MQQQTEPITPSTEPDTGPSDDEIARARAELERLLALADDCEAEANKIAKAYAASRPRDPALFARSQAKRDDAADASAAAEAFERANLSPLLARRAAAARVAAEAVYLARVRPALARFDLAGEHLKAFLRELDGAIPDFAGLHKARLAAQQAGVGLGRELDLSDIIGRINNGLEEFRDPAQQLQGSHAAAIYDPWRYDGQAVYINITRGAGAVPEPLRGRK